MGFSKSLGFSHGSMGLGKLVSLVEEAELVLFSTIVCSHQNQNDKIGFFSVFVCE
jgi:hypothetical protein